MNRVAHYLQEHLLGEVLTSTDARKYFSTDGGVFSVVPAMIVYPRNENDVRKVARFTWQLAERGRVIPITARGAGSDQAGAAIGTAQVGVLTADNIGAKTIDASKIAANSITAGNAAIANATVDTLQVAGNAITTPAGGDVSGALGELSSSHEAA